MVEYFLIYGDEKEPMPIGTDNGFGVFWADQGMTALMNIVDRYPDKLVNIKIKTDKNITLSVSQFLDNINKLKVRIK